MKTVLAKITDPISHADWKKKLSDVEFALNNTVHCTTKQTPSRMMFGIEQRGKVVDELTEYLHEIYTMDQESLDNIRARTGGRFQSLSRIIKNILKNTTDQQKNLNREIWW